MSTSQTPGISKAASAALATAAAAVGLATGGFTMYYTFRDRMAKEIEDRVTERVKTETRLARLEEQVKSVQAELWTMRTTPTSTK